MDAGQLEDRLKKARAEAPPDQQNQSKSDQGESAPSVKKAPSR
jgi:hypothetical protein